MAARAGVAAEAEAEEAQGWGMIVKSASGCHGDDGHNDISRRFNLAVEEVEAAAAAEGGSLGTTRTTRYCVGAR